MTNKLFVGQLVIQTVGDAFFAVFSAVINSCKEGTNFVKRLKNKRLLFPKKRRKLENKKRMYKAVMYILGKMGHISHDEFSISRAHEGVSVWTISISDILRKFNKSLMHKCLRRFWKILKMSVFSYFLAFIKVNSQKYGLFWLNMPNSRKQINNEGRKVKGSKGRQIAKFIKEISRVSCDLLSGE